MVLNLCGNLLNKIQGIIEATNQSSTIVNKPSLSYNQLMKRPSYEIDYEDLSQINKSIEDKQYTKGEVKLPNIMSFIDMTTN